jgi:hypothetical protein
MNVSFTRVSSNAKTGPIPTTTTTARSCPTACPFNHENAGGCYAEYGPQALHWRKVTSGERGSNWQSLCDNVASLPARALWRHNVAGDLPTTDRVHIDAGKLEQLVQANAGRHGFTYTHHDMTIEANRDAVRKANANGFTINLSGNNAAHADTLADMNIGPVVTVLPTDAPRISKTPAGRTIVACPAEYSDRVTCANCGLCQRQDRKNVIVGFHSHGTGKKKANAIAQGVAA